MADRAPTVRSLFCLAVALAGCASAATSPPVGTPEPLGAAEIEVAASLMRAEDQRLFDSAFFEAAARSSSPRIRAQTAMAIGRIGDEAAAPVARELLADPDSSVAAAAAFALGLLGDSMATPALSALIQPANAARSPTMAREAAAALGRIRSEEARIALSEFLRTTDVRSQTLQPVAGEALIAAVRAGSAPLDLIARWTSSPSAETRWKAAFALAQLGQPETVGLLMPMLDDSAALVRAHAIRGLQAPVVARAGVTSDFVLPYLTAAVQDEDYSVRIEAIRSIGSYPEAAALSALLPVLQSDRSHDVIVATESIGRLQDAGTGAAADLQRVARDVGRPPYVRVAALNALRGLQAPGLLNVLRELAADPSWRVRSAVVDGFAGFRAQAVPDLEALARDPDPRVAAAAVDAIIVSLGPSQIARVRPLLLELLEAQDPYVRAPALQGLAWLGDAATYPALLDAYATAQRDEDPIAAVAAVDAIADLGLAGMLSPERAFFARFPSPGPREAHRRAVGRFGDAAIRAWGEVPPPETGAPAPQYSEIVQEWLAPLDDELVLPMVRLDTERGPVVLRLLARAAPLTVANFLSLAEDGFYDGQEWARLVPDFMIQGGDPEGDTTGGPGYSIRDEPGRQRFQTGSVGMALSGPDSAGSQFFITYSPQPGLDGEFTVFAEVVSGHDVLQRLLPGDVVLTVQSTTEVEER